MNRRDLLRGAFLVGAAAPVPAAVTVPVQVVVNRHASCDAGEIAKFRSEVWNEAVRVFRQCGILLQVTERVGEIRHYPSGRPLFVGLERGFLNLVCTDHVPQAWDNARFVAGASTIYEGFHVSVVSMKIAHGNRVAFLDVNTVIHEMLHVFLQDIFVPRTGRLQAQLHETVVDWYATRMWLFSDGAAVRESTKQYMTRLTAPRTGIS